jgi:hypothetical protein
LRGAVPGVRLGAGMKRWPVRIVVQFLVLLASGTLAGCGPTGVGGADYAITYDFWEFYAVANRRPFRVVASGNPFPGLPEQESLQRLLPIMQANRPARPRVIFTYDTPAELPRPDYRMVLVFDPANDLGAQRACNGEFRHRPPTPGRLYVFAIYCRSAEVMSQTTAWTEASGPDDPRVGAMFSALFQVLFIEVNPNRPRIEPYPFMK